MTTPPDNVLVVAAHPDDELLGCGGTIARHAGEGTRVDILIVAEGATSRDAERDAGRRDAELTSLRRAAQAAAKTLGARPPRMLGFPDNRLDGVALLDIVKAIEAVVADTAPGTVYTHHAGDLNIDHRIVAQATQTACRPLPGAGVRRVYAFETLSSTEWSDPGARLTFAANHFVEITAQLETKLAALRHYATEMRAFPHPRSADAVRAMAALRGSTCGVPAAEAFTVVRQVVS